MKHPRMFQACHPVLQTASIGLLLGCATAFSQIPSEETEVATFPSSSSSEIALDALFSRIEKETGLEIKKGPQVEGWVSAEAVRKLDSTAILKELLPEEGFGVVRAPDSPVVWITAPIQTERFPLSSLLLDRLATKENLRKSLLGEDPVTPTDAHGKDLTLYRLDSQSLLVRDSRPNLVRAGRTLLDLEKEEIRTQAQVTSSGRRSQSFDSGTGSGNLVAREFVVVPSEDRAGTTPDAAYRRKRQVEMTEKIARSALYGPGGIEEAAAQGRVMYANPEEGTISVVDTPENLDKIEDYLRPTGGGGSAPSGGGATLRIYFPKHRTARDLGNAVNGIVPYVYY